MTVVPGTTCACTWNGLVKSPVREVFEHVGRGVLVDAHHHPAALLHGGELLVVPRAATGTQHQRQHHGVRSHETNDRTRRRRLPASYARGWKLLCTDRR